MKQGIGEQYDPYGVLGDMMNLDEDLEEDLDTYALKFTKKKHTITLTTTRRRLGCEYNTLPLQTK